MWNLIKKSTKKEFEHIRDGLKFISSDVFNGIGAILSLLTLISAIAVFIILLVKNATDGGYEEIFKNIFSIRGNAGSFYSMPYFGLLGALNIMLLLVSYFLFFKNEKIGFKILGAVPFLVIIVSFVTYFILMRMYAHGKYDNTPEHKRFVYGLMIAILVSAAISIILLLFREKVMSRSCLRMLILSFAILPFLTLCLENIGLLIAAVVVFIILCILIKGDTAETQSSTSPEPVSLQASSSGSAPAAAPAVPSYEAQQKAIFEINQRYKDGCAAIVKANNEVGAFTFSQKTQNEIAKLRKELEREAELRGVKGKVSIY